MEVIGRAHLDGVIIENHYLTGYTDDQSKLKSLLEDIDTTSGGVVKKYGVKEGGTLFATLFLHHKA